MSTLLKKYTIIQSCNTDLPNSHTGRGAKEVLKDAQEIYQELKLKEARLEGLGNYDTLTDEENEFIEVYTQKLNEFSRVCGEESESQNTNTSKIQKLESAIRGAKSIATKIKDNAKKSKLESAIRGAESILRKLKQ